jgi:hypothetical protein
MTRRVPVSHRGPSVSRHTPEWACPRVPLSVGEGPRGTDTDAGTNKQSRVLPGINAALANAIRRVNAAFNRLSPDAQNQVHIACDRPLDDALLSGDRTKALSAIEAWRDRQLADISAADWPRGGTHDFDHFAALARCEGAVRVLATPPARRRTLEEG